MAGPITNRLPRNPKDGTEICDRYGNKWQYIAENKAWISKGTISSYSVVNEEQNGLVDPTIFNKIKNLRTLSTQYDLSTTLKILPGKDAYWYYFRSSDKLIKFKPEGESILRVEIDKARLYQLLAKNRRPGLRGQQGDTGPNGPDGLPGESICYPDGGEPFYRPSTIEKSRLDFAIFTPTPLTLDGPINLPNNHVPTIAVRLFRIIRKTAGYQKVDQLQALRDVYGNGFNTAQKFEIVRNLLSQRSIGVKQSTNICNIPLSPVIVSPETLLSQASVIIDINPLKPSEISIATFDIDIDIDATKKTIVYDPITHIVCGSIFLAGSKTWDDIDEWCVKSRQRGPDGVQGEPGECRVKISENVVDDTNIQATCPIVNVRFNNDRNTLYTTCTDLLSEICVDKIKIGRSADTLTHRDSLKSIFAAAQTTLDECKYIHRYKFNIPDIDVPELELVHWDPQPGCVTRRNYDRHKFNWQPKTDIPKCDERGTWYGPTSTRSGKYPWEILLPSTPPDDECSEENFFYCPNVQDAPCPSPVAAASMRASDMYTGAAPNRASNESVEIGVRRWNIS